MTDLLDFEPDDGAQAAQADYTEDNIRTLESEEHIRRRPGMYIGKLGDGTAADDGIYVLIKEVLDNSIDEFMMGNGRQIIVDVDAASVAVRDYGRGIPLGSLIDAVSKMNTSGKFDTEAFQKSIGLNGVGLKAVNALSVDFEVRAVREGQCRRVTFSCGELQSDSGIEPCEEPNGTYVRFVPDSTIFRDYAFRDEFIEPMLKNYTYLNTGLTIVFNGHRFLSRHGLLDLLEQNMTVEPLYPIIHLKGQDIEVAITHANQYGEEYYSFVNGQHTTQGGTHLTAFKEAVSRTLKEFYGRAFDYSDIRNGMVAAIAIRVQEPIFESQTKTKLGSRDIGPQGPTVAKFVGDFIKRELDNYLHRDTALAEIILKKIQQSERDRKAMAGVTKLAREKAKKVSLHNRKLIDCNVHLCDARGSEEKKLASSIFLTEGDSAGGSITKIRDVDTQAVFMLRGKPLNTYGATQRVLYENEEFNLLQAALDIEGGIDSLRYNKVIIATDADVDGMHIRLLLITFFLQFFPDLIKKGHVYVLQTPLFRVRNRLTSKRSGRKKSAAADAETFYCYTDEERIAAIERLGANAEITRFKGLGEISPDEFRTFIGPDMRLDRVTMRKEDGVDALLEFYMGKNTMERQNFIIDNLVIEDDSEIS
ncbi:MAG: type IIA DNA topoisomerase subunit B [Bacteroides sp.]|nr:type IIA DNA topoisomerase subunit B [Bacteroides sp.]MCM1095765.1 type IIA DNA topoisomerase subunit B [Terasakiella sp.]